MNPVFIAYCAGLMMGACIGAAFIGFVWLGFVKLIRALFGREWRSTNWPRFVGIVGGFGVFGGAIQIIMAVLRANGIH